KPPGHTVRELGKHLHRLEVPTAHRGTDSGINEIHLAAGNSQGTSDGAAPACICVRSGQSLSQATCMLDELRCVASHKAGNGHLINRRQAQPSWRFHAREGWRLGSELTWDKREMLMSRGCRHQLIVGDSLYFTQMGARKTENTAGA